MNGAAQTFVQQAKLLASDSVLQDGFGFSVAISGDAAIVGGPRNGATRGAAFIYVRAGSTWTQQQQLIHSDAMGNDQFGYSVATNGNPTAVGRFNTITGMNRSDGRVYIFTKTGTTWRRLKLLFPTISLKAAFSVVVWLLKTTRSATHRLRAHTEINIGRKGVVVKQQRLLSLFALNFRSLLHFDLFVAGNVVF